LLADQHSSALRESSSKQSPLSYGRNTLTEGLIARYEFWPSMDTPLLNSCAQAILAASSNSTLSMSACTLLLGAFLVICAAASALHL
jgi:hypothetical protein